MTDLRPIYFAEARARLVGNRLAVYMALTEAGPSTPKELAARMGWDVTSVRPRITEMRQIHAVIETGIRRNGEHEFRALTAAQMQDQHEAEMEAERKATEHWHPGSALLCPQCGPAGLLATRLITITHVPTAEQLELIAP